ncbi:hypothetical protein [Dapis sp. BLCC M126]|uniref:hypothetical protein n=1 Tax=Dapis sp. BLCC M126 TaxID=3400189 RepID=UPI003CEC48F9
MSAGIVCVKPRVNIYRKFTFFQAFKPSSVFLLPSSLPSLYNTDATGHDIRDACDSLISLLYRSLIFCQALADFLNLYTQYLLSDRSHLNPYHKTATIINY